MKQLLFLLLFPCLAMAQYQGNAGQKITLGEQTTADGLVFRGVAYIDTVTATSKITRANKQDTSAYILLDTVTNLLWHYKTASNGWIQAGGSTLDTATMLLPYYRAGRNTIIQSSDVPTLNQNTTGSAATLTTGRTIQTNLASTSTATFNGSANITPGVTGVLPVANGGTNTSTLTLNKVMVGNGTSGVVTPTNLHWDNTNNRLGIETSSPSEKLHVVGNGFYTGNLGVGSITNPYNFAKNLTISAGTTAPVEAGITIQGAKESNVEFGAIHGYNKNNRVVSIFFSRDNSQDNSGAIAFQTSLNGTMIERFQMRSDGEVRIKNLAGSGSRAVLADNNGALSAPVSSITTKENVQTLNYGLSELLQIKPVSFDYIDKYKWGEDRNLGFIVEDMFPVIPEVTGTMNTGDMYLDMTKLIPVLTKAIQEQNALIKALEQRILMLENK